MTIKVFKELPKEAIFVRETVFVNEQGFNEEFDDMDNISTHIVMFDGSEPVAVCRVYFDDAVNTFVFGRLAVVSRCRGRGLGAQILNYAEKSVKEMGGQAIILHAQVRAKHFYEKQGYSSYGEIDLDEDCPHIWMKKDLLNK